MSALTGIEGTLDRIVEDTPDASTFYEQLAMSAPFVVGYLLDSDTEMLSDEEQDYLLFLGMVLVSFLREQGFLTSDVDPEVLGKHEESVWNAEGFAAPAKVHPRLEEINAFIEEALVQDKDTSFLEEGGVQIIYAKLYALALTAVKQASG
jgi:hypothetical protein